MRLALIVRIEVAPPVLEVTGFGLKVALVRGGNPMTLRLTELEVFVALTVTVVGAFEPRLTVSKVGASETVSKVGASEIVKSGVLVDPPAVKEAIAVLQLKLKNGLFLV